MHTKDYLQSDFCVSVLGNECLLNHSTKTVDYKHITVPSNKIIKKLVDWNQQQQTYYLCKGRQTELRELFIENTHCLNWNFVAVDNNFKKDTITPLNCNIFLKCENKLCSSKFSL